MEIKSDIYDIYETGSIISINKKPIDFIFDDLTFRFIFEDDNTKEKNQLRAEKLPDQQKGLNVIFSNFNETLGVGNSVPIPIGWIQNRNLYLNYRIYCLTPESDKLIHFTWYLGEVRNG
jgi:hypothetical protein